MLEKSVDQCCYFDMTLCKRINIIITEYNNSSLT